MDLYQKKFLMDRKENGLAHAPPKSSFSKAKPKIKLSIFFGEFAVMESSIVVSPNPSSTIHHHSVLVLFKLPWICSPNHQFKRKLLYMLLSPPLELPPA